MIEAIRSRLRATRPFREITERLASGAATVDVGGAGASILSFLAADLAEGPCRTVLLVVPRPDEAERFAEEIGSLLGARSVSLFPPWELLPYEPHSPPAEVTALRLRALGRLARGEAGVVVTSPRALQTRVVPRRVLAEQWIELGKGREIDLGETSERLVHIGFRRVPIADRPGTFARRGGIIDLFPAGGGEPVRVELFGDEIESIRAYDPASQRSIRPVEAVRIGPQREFPLPDDAVLRLQDLALPGREGERLARGAFFDGIERFLPLVFPEAETLLDYLPAASVIVALEEREILAAAVELWEEAVRFHGVQEVKEILPPPEKAFLDGRGVEEAIHSRALVNARRSAVAGEEGGVSIRLVPAPPVLGKLDLLEKEVRGLLAQEYAVHVFCDNRGQVARMEEILEPFAGRIAVGVGKLRRGFLLPDERIALLADSEIFRRLRRRLDRPRPRGRPIDSYLALRKGDLVVHVIHGIGRFEGVERIDVDGVGRDCVLLRYAGGDRLFVPTDQIDSLQKFSGAEGAPPPVDKIGGKAWARVKERARKAVRETAAGLIRLYAARRARPGFAFSPDGPWQRELESSFLYEETPHQAAAVAAVKRDMEAPRPMDRLVCGDVGYGKTEVAVRAAFKAVVDGKQVAILVPTTLLAHQHYRTFADRLGAFPVRVEVLSRFRRVAEVRGIVKDLAAGRIDILIGTHRLLQKDIAFRELGLVVVDEEQRFGVAQKEKLKKMRETVDVLTLTATPIPRTLHMSLSGVRDMSVIETPPKDRLPIVTEVIEFDPEVIVAAALRELDRGGQVFFVHNRVRSIDSLAAYLGRIVPEARIGVAHGQMTERRLESVMFDFLERKIDILVSTMIIESGLDIPSVNTMLVNRADHFGLAQLYQLRGRVGRSNHRAYTYLIVPRDRVPTESAAKRLEAITTHTELGSGYRIAMKDLEIRGAGNLLGAEQHGFVATVGFEMYCRLLEEAVRDLRGEESPRPTVAKIEAAFDAFLPDEYVGDAELKIVLYRRLAATREGAEVASMRCEVEDRFGRMPPPAERLFALREVKLAAERVGAEAVRIGPGRVRVRYGAGVHPPREGLRRLADEFREAFSFDAEEAARGFAVQIETDGGAELRAARKVLSVLS